MQQDVRAWADVNNFVYPLLSVIPSTTEPSGPVRQPGPCCRARSVSGGGGRRK